MIFARRDGRRPGRFTALRLGLFFLAAGTWLAGLVTGRGAITGVAIAILALAVLLGLADRGDSGAQEPDDHVDAP